MRSDATDSLSATGSVRRTLRVALPLVGLLMAASAQAGDSSGAPTSSTRLVDTYRNPFGFGIADPSILQEGDTYYLYGTTQPGRGFEVYTSHDLVHWRLHGMCYEESRDSWGRTNFWAPEVLKKDGTYYLFYTAENPRAGIKNICVATSDSPTGPFTDLKAPLFPHGSFIDGHVFFDEDSGEYYIYMTEEGRVPATILGARLSDSLTEVETTFTACLKPGQPWEDGWIEGTFIMKHGGTYYMMYSGSAFWEPAYAVGYATAPHPLGPWTKSEDNPILRAAPGVDGPGHNCVAWSPDRSELFMVYHRHATFWNARRELAIDRIEFVPSPDGPARMTLPHAPSTTPQPLPSGSPPRLAGTTDEFDGATLDFSRWMTLNEQRDQWRLSSGSLVIAAQSGDFFRDHESGRNLFLQTAPNGDFSVSTQVTFHAVHNNEHAFVTVWMDQDNHLMLTTGMYDGPGFVTLQERHGKNTMFVYPNRLGDTVHLRITRRGTSYTFHVSGDGADWRQIGPPVESDLTPACVGLGAFAPGSDRAAEAVFESIRLDSAPEADAGAQ